MQATGILVLVNLVFIVAAFSFARYTDTLSLLVLILTVATILAAGLFYSLSRKNRLRQKAFES